LRKLLSGSINFPPSAEPKRSLLTSERSSVIPYLRTVERLVEEVYAYKVSEGKHEEDNFRDLRVDGRII
jgi:hypothetical protein